MKHVQHILAALAYAFEKASDRQKFVFNKIAHSICLPDLRAPQQVPFISHVMQIALKLSEDSERHREIHSWILQYETRPALCREEFLESYDKWFLSAGDFGHEYSYLSENGRSFGRQVYQDFPVFFDALTEEVLLENTDGAPDIHPSESAKRKLIYIAKDPY